MVEIMSSIKREITAFTLDALIKMVQVASLGGFSVDILHCAV